MTATVLGEPHALTGLRGRDFLKEIDLSVTEWTALVELAAELKNDRRMPGRVPRLQGCNLALIFEKPSTRTRCAFEVAAYDEGAHVTYLDPADSHLGRKESVADTARVLSRMYDGIAYRGSDHVVVEDLARHASVPVWNGLTNEWHPTQSLADVLTMIEHTDKPTHEISLAYVGDARNNVARSLLVAGALMGMDVRMVAPTTLQPPSDVAASARVISSATGARVIQTSDVAGGVSGVDFVYTDVWVSMDEPEAWWDERLKVLRPYRVDRALLAKTGNPAVKFMHCLPALHDAQTQLGSDLLDHQSRVGIEVSDEVFESASSIVFDQAENRMHAIKAVLVATLGEPRCAS